MKVMMKTPIAGDNFSLRIGEVVDLARIYGDRAEEIGAEWIKAEYAIEAPAEADAANSLAELQQAHDALKAKSDGLEKELIETRGKLAAAQKEKQGAIAEAEVHRKANETLTAERDALRAQLAEKKPNEAPKPPKL